jgi:hypothetical protein
MTVLILTSKDDAHVDFFIDQSHRDGLDDCLRINTEDFIDNIRTTVTLNGFKISALDSGRACDSNTVSGVWYRRPLAAKMPPYAAEGYDEFASSECWEVIYGIYASCRKLTCLPGPRFAGRPASKIRQMLLASELGLNIPDFCVSNVYSDIIDFVDQFPELVLKTLRWPSFNSSDGCYPLYSVLVEKGDMVGDADGYSNGLPKFLQKRIVKKYDVRVVVIGDCVSAVAMESTSDLIDIRRVPHASVGFREVDLPEAVKKPFLKLLEKDELNYSSADFVVDNDDTWWFLENNPNGQFYWIEQASDIPLMAKLMEFLRR